MIRKTTVLMCLVALLTSGCLYTNVQRPLDKDLQNTDLGSKEGRSSNRSVLWLFAWGDAGTKAAAENGDITVINHADQEFMVVLFGLYSRYTMVVYGD
ncbi:MAG: hypothetical protein FJ119_04845 [Deltaproteobacteria bacterium]|nr:hypothetical protein [Deltaproteobacteria bacterium]